MKKIFLITLFIAISFFVSVVFGKDESSLQFSWSNQQSFCIKDKYYLVGLNKVKKLTNVTYIVSTKENLEINGRIFYEVLDWSGIILYTGTANQKINLFFSNIWQYTLKVYIKEKSCSYELEKEIRVYNKIIFYLGVKNEKLLWLKPLIDKEKNTLFIDLFIPKKWYYTWDEFLKEVLSYVYYLKNTDVLLIYYPRSSYIFDGLIKIQNLYNINFSKKRIFIIWKISFLEKKILLKYMKILFLTKLWIIKSNYFLDFFERLLNNKNINWYVSYFKLSGVSESKYFILSAIITWLIYNGFPSNLLTIVLLIPLVLLLITFFRQMIGFHVFWVYNPLIFSLILVIFWFRFSFVLFFVGVVSVLISKFFIKKIYLLYSSKLTLFYIIYIIVLIFTVYLLDRFWIDVIFSSVFKNIFIVFPIISFGVVINKLITEDIKIFSVKFLVSLLEFFILSIIWYFVFTNTYLQNLFLVYPELIFVILVINMIIWRFTWLQLFEYFRFMPLIKKQLEE